MANLSKSQLSTETTHLKIPFTISQDELEILHNPDTRIGGFGPWFGGAILITIFLLATWAWRLYKQKDSLVNKILIAILVILFGSILITPGGWWARYTPQLWMIPIFSVLLVLSTEYKNWEDRDRAWIKDDFNKNFRRFRLRAFPKKLLFGISYLLIITLLINVVIVSSAYYLYQYKNSIKLDQELAKFEAIEAPLQVDFSYAVGNIYRFDQRGIDYEFVDNPVCAQPIHLPTAASTVVCP